MNILIAEYVISNKPSKSSESLLPEAYAMVSSAYEVLKDYGKTYVLVNKAYRSLFNIKESSIIYSTEFIESLEKFSKNFDNVILVAPPTALIEASRIVDNDKLLGPAHDVIKMFSLKDVSYSILHEINVRTPRHIVFSDRKNIELINLPVVVKPVDSAGGSAVFLADNVQSMEKTIRTVLKFSEVGKVVIQEFVEGVHGSISVITDGQNIFLLTNNVQIIKFSRKGKLSYRGGIVFLRNPELYRNSMELVERIIRGVKGFRGYFGIDVVWNSWKPYVIEVNPRLTTSFVGLAKILGKALGCLMLKSVGLNIKCALKKNIKGYVGFIKKGNVLLTKYCDNIGELIISLRH